MFAINYFPFVRLYILEYVPEAWQLTKAREKYLHNSGH